MKTKTMTKKEKALLEAAKEEAIALRLQQEADQLLLTGKSDAQRFRDLLNGFDLNSEEPEIKRIDRDQVAVIQWAVVQCRKLPRSRLAESPEMCSFQWLHSSSPTGRVIVKASLNHLGVGTEDQWARREIRLAING